MRKGLMYSYKMVILLLLISLFALVLPTKADENSIKLTVTVMTQYYVDLNWDTGLASKYAFKIERKVDSGAFAEIAGCAYNKKDYSDQNLSTAHSYTYRIKAYDTTNASTAPVYSNEVSCNTLNYDKPTSLTVTPMSNSQIDLTWSYPESKNYNTVIERSYMGWSSWIAIASVPAGTYSYSDTGLVEDVQYYYRIKAVYKPNVVSDFFPGDVGLSAYTKLATPKDVYGYAVSSSQINLMWNAGSDIYMNYDIERKAENSSTYTLVGTTSNGNTSWIDSGLTANSRYTYRIRGNSGDNYSNYTEEITVNCVYVTEPLNFAAAAQSGSGVKLTWIDNSNDETGFEIWRKAGAGDWEKYASVDRNVTSYMDTDASPNTIYIYKIRGRILYSDAYSAFTKEARTWNIDLSPPINLKYTVLADTVIELQWEDNEKNETGFAVERKTGVNGNWVEIATLESDNTSYTDDTLEPTEQYYYRIKIYDDNYYNSYSYSNEIRVNTTVLEGPTEFAVVAISTSDVKLTWKDNSSNELGFRIDRMSTEDSDFMEIARVKANATSYMDHGLKAATNYLYRIYAYYDNGNSDYFEDYSVDTLTPIQLKDIPENYWAKNEIDSLVSKGIFNLKEGASFNPSGKMTRGELAHLLVKAFNLDKNRTAVGSYADVKPKYKYYKDIMIADKLGIITKSKSNYFYPERTVSRQDLAVFIDRTLKAVGKPLKGYDLSIMDRFPDKKEVSTSAIQSVLSMFGEGIMTGVTKNGKRVIAPNQSVARADVSVVLFKVIDR